MFLDIRSLENSWEHLVSFDEFVRGQDQVF